MSNRPTLWAAALILGLGAPALLSGCHGPAGAWMSYTGGSNTFESHELMPKTVKLIDLRTNEVIFSMDIPAYLAVASIMRMFA